MDAAIHIHLPVFINAGRFHMRFSVVAAALSGVLSVVSYGGNGVATLDFLPTEQVGSSGALQNPTVRVWVNLSSRVYHCPGGRYYGATKRGKFMTEVDAQKTGNRPAYGRGCGSDGDASGASSNNSAATLYSSTATVAHSSANVTVWVNRKSHVYHCPGTQYYGATKSGEFMTESEATASGNRPAYGRSCG
jgi:hypothetical protein